jgi:hypothetical protein
MDISEPIKSTECQGIMPPKQAERCDKEQSKVINEEYYKEIAYHDDASESINSRITQMIKSSMNHTSYVLNTTISSVLADQTYKKDLNAKMVSSSHSNESTTHSWKREFNKGTRFGTKVKTHWLRPILVSLIMFMMTIVTSAQAKDPVCNKSTEIKYYDQFEELEGCSVIEGELTIAIIHEDCGNIIEVCKDEKDNVVNCTGLELQKIENHKICTGFRNRLIAGNLTFPKLREVTDFVVLYSTKHIKTLSTLFPNLTVIRGTRLIKVYQIINNHVI